MSDRIALYFGSLGDGHYLHGIPLSLGPHRRTIWPEVDVRGFPWRASHLDGGLLKNKRVEDWPDGRVFWTVGRDISDVMIYWLAFFWWDRTGDKRGGSNSGFYIRGYEWTQRDEAFEFAKSTWPEVAARQVFPLVIQP